MFEIFVTYNTHKYIFNITNYDEPTIYYKNEELDMWEEATEIIDPAIINEYCLVLTDLQEKNPKTRLLLAVEL
jgi:hypothetical protein